MIKEQVITVIKELTGHPFSEIVLRGNSAIKSALSILPEKSTILIPEEGGWLSYQTIPTELGLNMETVQCHDARISLNHLQEKLASKRYAALLYQNPGGYCADQPMKEIYALCQKNKAMVILDVSGSIGTKLCDGHQTDILVGSFGRWKLIDAQGGGFISAKDKTAWEKIVPHLEILNDEKLLGIIAQKADNLQTRIKFLMEKTKAVVIDLSGFNIIYSSEVGGVVVVKFTTDVEKEKIIKYCQEQQLPWRDCPRYIRLNAKAISIELKQLETAL